MSIDYSEYADLNAEGGGFSAKAPIAPEDEFFHSLYISGQQRKNHLGETEYPGKLQIRGFKTNLDNVYMAITHVHNVLVKTTRVNNRDQVECFSYQTGSMPYKGTSGNICGKNSAERAASPFCNPCRSQLIVTGVYVEENGTPLLVDGKPVFIFIRAKGVKYGKVQEYLMNMSNKEFDPIISPQTTESKEFEKKHVNHKRNIVKISIGSESTNFGMKDVFYLSEHVALSTDAVKQLLDLSKKYMDKFKEKFDWSKNTSGQSNYTETPKPSESQQFNFNQTSSPAVEQKTESKPAEKPKESSSISFEDLQF